MNAVKYSAPLRKPAATREIEVTDHGCGGYQYQDIETSIRTQGSPVE